jgi:hypothetical protein
MSVNITALSIEKRTAFVTRSQVIKSLNFAAAPAASPQEWLNTRGSFSATFKFGPKFIVDRIALTLNFTYYPNSGRVSPV